MAKEIKFSKFLKENGAYKKFIKNFKRDIIYNLDKKLVRREEHICFGNAFVFSDATEGWGYWHSLYMKWLDLDKGLMVYDMDWLLEKGEIK